MKRGLRAILAGLLMWNVCSAQAFTLTALDDGSYLYEFASAHSLSITGSSAVDLSGLVSLQALSDSIRVVGSFALLAGSGDDALMAGDIVWHPSGDQPNTLDIRSDASIQLNGSISGFDVVKLAGTTIVWNATTSSTAPLLTYSSGGDLWLASGSTTTDSSLGGVLTISSGADFGTVSGQTTTILQAPVPEPGTYLLMAAGLLVFPRLRRRS